MRAIPHYQDMYNGKLPKQIDDAYMSALIVLQGKAWVHYSVMLNTPVIWTDQTNMGTAATDGAYIYICPKYFMGLADDYLRASLLFHEVEHVILRHPFRGKFYQERGYHSLRGADRVHYDAMLYNVAADYVVNADMQAHGLPVHDTWLKDAKYSRDHLVDMVYLELVKENQQQGSQGSTGQQGSQPGQGGQSHDEHLEPQYGPGDDGMSEAEQREQDIEDIQRRVDDALEDAAENGKGIGKVSANVKQAGFVSGHAEASSTDWKAELADLFVRSGKGGDINWKKIHRRRWVTMGVVSPTTTGTLDRVIWEIDISGSVSRQALNQASVEVAAMLDMLQPASGCLVMFVNTNVVGTHEVFSGQELLDLQIPNHGGTYMTAGVRWLEREGITADLHLCFTDGEMSYDDFCGMAAADAIIVLDRHPDAHTASMIKQSGVRTIVASDKLAA